MAEVSREIPVSAERVWEVIADGWSYAGWVVGASHIREVDQGWPALGTRIHHSIGFWPVEIEDTTEVKAVEPLRMLELDARMWPVGAVVVRLELHPVAPDRTRVRMIERATRGPATVLPKAVQNVLFPPRNRAALARLADLAVRRQR
jgi:hypothetical protein